MSETLLWTSLFLLSGLVLMCVAYAAGYSNGRTDELFGSARLVAFNAAAR